MSSISFTAPAEQKPPGNVIDCEQRRVTNWDDIKHWGYFNDPSFRATGEMARHCGLDELETMRALVGQLLLDKHNLKHLAMEYAKRCPTVI